MLTRRKSESFDIPVRSEASHILIPKLQKKSFLPPDKKGQAIEIATNIFERTENFLKNVELNKNFNK